MKSAIVTGAGGNLGLAVCKQFIANDYHVTGTIATRGRNLDLPKESFSARLVDLNDEDNCESFVSSVIAEKGKIDTAVLTAGGYAAGDISDTKSGALLGQYRVNFETAYHIARPVFMHMKKTGYGRIFLIGARPGLTAANGKDMIAYSLSKSLLFRLAELMNLETKGTNVVTSVVVPSTIDTPQNRQNMPDADTGKWVSPESIAKIIHFYTTPDADALRQPLIKAYANG